MRAGDRGAAARCASPPHIDSRGPPAWPAAGSGFKSAIGLAKAIGVVMALDALWCS